MGDLARLGRTALEVPRIAFGAAALSFGGGTGSEGMLLQGGG